MTVIPPELIARLACLMETYQLKEFITACETVKEAGHGWGSVEITFKVDTIDINCHFALKPRPDQSRLMR